MNINYIKLHKEAVDLCYAKDGDAGMDLAVTDFVCLGLAGTAGSKRLCGTGIAVEIPEGYFGLVVPRSSTGKLGVRLANTVGIIDSGYRGEIKLFLENTSPTDVCYVQLGQRVGQLIVLPYLQVNPVRVLELEETDRGSGGFGSTG